MHWCSRKYFVNIVKDITDNSCSITSTSCIITSLRLGRPEGRSVKQRHALTKQSSYDIFFYIHFISRIDDRWRCQKKSLSCDRVRYKNRICPPHLPSGAKNLRRPSYVIDDATRKLGRDPFFPEREKSGKFIQLNHSFYHHYSLSM